MTSTAVEPEPTAPAVGGVRASWWNAVVSLVVAVLASHVPVVVFVVSGTAWGDHGVPPSGVRLVLVVIVGAVSCAAQLAMIPWLRSGLGGGVGSPALALSAVVAGVAVWIALVQEGVGVLPLVSALSVVACISRTVPRRMLFVVAVVLAAVAWALSGEEHVVPAMLVITLVYPYLVFASVWAWDVVTRLDAARATEADLAVARERLRFASDLHDIQGHSLQVIALKAELAERLLGADPDAAAVQISEVRVEAADALTRTRELARGYRATGIEDELDNARDVLTVAGFECATEVEALPRDSTIRSLLGRALREATTNVLRHADAGPVHIGLGRRPAVGGDAVWQLRVVNQVSAPTGSEDLVIHDGAGLAGLADRADRLGGRVETEVRDSAGRREFVLTVAVPAGAGAGEPS